MEPFEEFLSRVISGDVGTRWRLPKDHFHCSRLEEAFNGYVWNGDDYAATNCTLDRHKTELREAIALGDGGRVRMAVEHILVWGRVFSGGNSQWLKRGDDDALMASLIEALEFAQAPNFDEREFQRVKARSNAGLTKVYSLALDNFVIYDSRVAAALQMLVAMFLEHIQSGALPDELAFVGMASKSVKAHRQGAFLGKSFPQTHNRHHVHMRWNLAANRVLTGAIRRAEGRPGAAWCAGRPDGLRRLEAALFMAGYDLPHEFRVS